MTIWIVNGHTDVGQWELEIYKDYGEAVKAFEDYVNEYDAQITDKWFAECDEGVFWIEEHDI